MDWSALFNNIGNLLKKNTPVTPTVVTPTIVKEVTKTPVILEPTITVSTQEVTASVTTNIPVIEVSKPKQYIITKEQLKAICPTANVEFVDAINKYATKYEINTKLRMAGFLSQVLHESAGFKLTRERLNYSPKRLLEVFPSRVKTIENAKTIVAGGEKAIANFLYNGRYGNRVNSNDGWDYRGGGLTHLTFRLNYKDIGEAIGVDLETHPELIITPDVAVESAFYYWKSRKVNVAADKGDVVGTTKLINGGTNGIDGRRAIYIKALQILK